MDAKIIYFVFFLKPFSFLFLYTTSWYSSPPLSSFWEPRGENLETEIFFCIVVIYQIASRTFIRHRMPALPTFLFGLCLVSSLFAWLMLFVSLALSRCPFCAVLRNNSCLTLGEKIKIKRLLHGAIQTYVAILPGT